MTARDINPAPQSPNHQRKSTSRGIYSQFPAPRKSSPWPPQNPCDTRLFPRSSAQLRRELQEPDTGSFLPPDDLCCAFAAHPVSALEIVDAFLIVGRPGSFPDWTTSTPNGGSRCRSR